MGRRSSEVRLVALLVLVVAVAACTDAPAERGGGIRTVPVSVGFADRRAENDGPAGPAFLAALVDESDGALGVEPAPRPGADAGAVLDEVRRGDLDLAWIRSDALEAAGIGRMAALSAPFVVTTPQARGAVTDPGVAAGFLSSLQPAGVTGLALWGGPLRRPIAADRPLLGPATWTGRRVRSGSPTQSATFAAFGATPVEVAGDLNQLVPIDAVEAAETDVGRQLVAADYTIAPYITADVVLWSRFLVLVANQEWFAGLGDQAQGWIRAAAEAARQESSDPGAGIAGEAAVVPALCEAGARFPAAGPSGRDDLATAAGPVLAALRADPQDGPLLAAVEAALAGLDGTPDPLAAPAWCAGPVSPLQPATQPPRTRSPVPPGTYRTHLSAEDIADAGVGKVQDAQVVTLVIGADGGYTNTSRFDDDGEVMVFEAGEVWGDDEVLHFVNDLDELKALAGRGVRACVWTDPSLGCITNTNPYSVRWRLLPDRSIELSDPRGINPDPVMVLTFVANPYRRVG